MKKIFIFLVLIFTFFANPFLQKIMAEGVKCDPEKLQHPDGYIKKEHRENMCKYGEVIGKFENGNKNDFQNYCIVNGSKIYYNEDKPPEKCNGYTETNTAKGYFQMIDSTFKETLEKMPDSFPRKEAIYMYTYEEQLQLAWKDWASRAERYGEADLINSIYASKDPDAALIAYCKYHHTQCSDISQERMEELIEEIQRWSEKNINPEVIAKYTQKGTDISAEERKKLEEERWAEKCEGRTYGLVGYEGGICSGEQSGSAAFIALIQNALAWVIRIAFLVAVLAIFYAGFILVTANGQPAKRTQALSILKNVIIGLFLISAAWLLVDWFFELFIPAENISDYKWIKNN